MIYGEILAGGKGTRMGNTPLPKQFLPIANRPIVLQTIDQFLLHEEFRMIFVVVPEDWMIYAKDLISKYSEEYKKKIQIVKGGGDRNSTVMNGIAAIREKFGIEDDDIVVTHDAVRPFVSYRIIEENIKAAQRVGAADTAIPAIDTIVKVDTEKLMIDEIPERKIMYQGQTPQSFNINELQNAYDSMTDQEKNILTDAAKILRLQNKEVFIVEGEQQNFKITTSFDYQLAKSLVSKRK